MCRWTLLEDEQLVSRRDSYVRATEIRPHVREMDEQAKMPASLLTQLSTSARWA